MLIGTYRHQIDEKYRFRMPSKFKDVLKDGYILTKGTNNCIFAMPAEDFNKLYDKLAAVPIFDTASQKAIRFLLSSAFESEEDKQGRTLLPKELREYAKITKNIVTIGAGSRVEIWAEEVWNTYSADDFTSAAEALGQRGV